MGETPRPSAKVTATGTAVGRKAVLRKAVLSGGAVAPVVLLRDGGAAGTEIVTLKAPVGDSRDFSGFCKEFATDIHVTVVSGNADLYLEYE